MKPLYKRTNSLLKKLGDKMSDASLDKEKLQKLFYFSLKKTENPHETEDIVQDTALEMIKMLNNGYKPDNFNAWMWMVVRKRYAPVGYSSFCNRTNDGGSHFDYFKIDVADFMPAIKAQLQCI